MPDPYIFSIAGLNFASTESKVSGLPGRIDGPADAYRHILWAAELTRLYGPKVAYVITSAHELTNIVGDLFGWNDNRTSQSTAMDMHNNQI